MFQLRGTHSTRRLVAWFTITTILPAVALGWAGWRMAIEDRTLQHERAREARDQAAELAATALQRTVAELNLAEWTPDGRRILFNKRQDYMSTWIVPASGGTPVQVALERGALAAGRIHPDGRRIAFTAQGSQPSEVSSLENFQPAPSAAKK